MSSYATYDTVFLPVCLRTYNVIIGRCQIVVMLYLIGKESVRI